VSLFAYGQTGSGKSYSMVGYGADKGIIPLACAELFNRVAGTVEEGVQFKVRCAQRRLRGVSESRGSVRGSRKQRRGAEGGARGAGQVEASMMEIYNERVRDLFNPRHPANNTGLKVPANSRNSSSTQ
jgi:kinesin family protein 1